MLSAMPALTQHDLMAVAVRARVDVRTVTRRLAGLPQLADVVARIDAALRELGFSPPTSPAPAHQERAPLRRAAAPESEGRDGEPGNSEPPPAAA